MRAGQGQGEPSDGPANAHTLAGRCGVTDRAAGQGCQSERPRETQTNITCSVKAFPGDNHRNNTLDTVTGHIWQLLKKQPSPPKPPGGSKVPLAQFKKSRKEEGPREGKRRLQKQLHQLPPAPICLSHSVQNAACLHPLPGKKASRLDGPGCWRQMLTVAAAERLKPRAALPSLQPQARTPHPPFPQRGLVHRNVGYSLLYQNPQFSSTNGS